MFINCEFYNDAAQGFEVDVPDKGQTAIVNCEWYPQGKDES